MKVLAINGSPHKEGGTYQAIRLIAEELQKQKIETEIIHVGMEAIHGCTGCGFCKRNDEHLCVFDDVVNL